MMEIRVTSVQTNLAVPAMPVPEEIRSAPAAPPERADVRKIGDGVWLIAGGSHHSLAVEFADHLAMIEAPLSEARSIAVLEAVSKAIPNKPVRYIVNTHHHLDHLAGLRTYIAQGSTLVTHRDNADFYEKVMFATLPRTLMPDRLSTFYPNFAAARRPVIERVNQKYVLSDGFRYPVKILLILLAVSGAGIFFWPMYTVHTLMRAERARRDRARGCGRRRCRASRRWRTPSRGCGWTSRSTRRSTATRRRPMRTFSSSPR